MRRRNSTLCYVGFAAQQIGYSSVKGAHMKYIRISLGITSLVLCLYFSIMRFDIILRIFREGIAHSEIGGLILPILLLVVGVVFLVIRRAK